MDNKGNDNFFFFKYEVYEKSFKAEAVFTKTEIRN